MDWLRINELTKDQYMEWCSLDPEFPCRFDKDKNVPIEKLARILHSYKQPYTSPQFDITNHLLFRAAHCLHDSVDLRKNCIEDRKKGELWTRQSYDMSDKDFSFWQKTERYEIDRIADMDLQCNFIIRELLRVIENAERHLVITEKCLNLRINILHVTSDCINTALENERELLQNMIKDLKKNVEEMEKRLKRLRLIRPYVQKDVQYKTVAASINQSCEHNDRLLLYLQPPQITTEPKKFQRLNYKVWNDNANALINTSMDIREGCCSSYISAEHSLQEYQRQLYETWKATNNVINSEIDKNNDHLEKIRAEIASILYNIQFANQRTLSIRRSGFQEQHALQLALWRQQRDFLKPPREQIQDKCCQRIEEELKASDNRVNNIDLCLKRNEEIHADLQDKRRLLEKQYDLISLHLYVDREYCQGLRRTIKPAQLSERLAKKTGFHPTPFPLRWKLNVKDVSTCICY